MQQLTYEQAISELQQIIAELQSGGDNIDQLTTKSGRAAELIKYCKNKLRHTETQIENLLPELELDN